MIPPLRLPKGKFTDNDESERKRAREVDKLNKAPAYNDIGTQSAERDYDMLRRVRRSRVKYPSPSRGGR